MVKATPSAAFQLEARPRFALVISIGASILAAVGASAIV